MEFSNDALSKVRGVIKHQLLVRGINVDVVVRIDETRRGEQKFSVEATEFQTMPVLGKSWKVVDFGSWINQIEESEAVKVTICLQARYTAIDGGTNGISLFTLSFNTNGEVCQGFIMGE